MGATKVASLVCTDGSVQETMRENARTTFEAVVHLSKVLEQASKSPSNLELQRQLIVENTSFYHSLVCLVGSAQECGPYVQSRMNFYIGYLFKITR